MARDDQAERPAIAMMAAGWEGVSAIEFADYLLFSDVLARRRPDGTMEETRVFLRVPREHEFRKARVRARELAAVDGLDPTRDADLVKNLENICLLAVAVRNSTPPHEPFEPDPLRLERVYDRVCLAHLWERIDEINTRLNPGPGTIGENEMYVLLAKLAKERTLDPLVGYGSAARTTFTLFMVDLLMSFLGLRSSSESSALSTPER